MASTLFWLQSGGCGGDTLSLLNAQDPDILQLCERTGLEILHTQTLSIPLNRVEGDLKLSAEIVAHQVVEAFCSGTMYRGFENLLVGRGALDGLAITPRICGICGLSHPSLAPLSAQR